MTRRAIQISFCAPLVAALIVGAVRSDEPPKAQPERKSDKAGKGTESDEEYRRAA